MPRIDRSSLGLLAAAALAITATLAPRAAAQGTAGSLPSPISSVELSGFADRLQLSVPQRAAWEAIHDDYKRQFRALRDGEITGFLDEQRRLQGGIPKLEAVTALIEQLERIDVKIRLLDDHLFDQLQPLLSPGQIARLPRVRLARERARYRVLQRAILLGRRAVDLSDLYQDLDLTGDALAASDPMMARYEERLTSLMRKNGKTAARMTLDMMEALAERGYSDLSQEQIIADPELLRGIMAGMQEIYANLKVQSTEIADELETLNERTYRSIAAVLPEEASRRFGWAYTRARYPEVGSIVTAQEDDWMRRALEASDLASRLTAEEREQLQAGSAEYQASLEALLRDGIDRVDTFRENSSPFSPDPEGTARYGKDLDALRKEARTLSEGSFPALEKVIGEDRAEQLRAAVAEAAAPADGAGAPGGGEASGGAADDEVVYSGDPFVPARISRRDVRRYATALGLDESDGTVLSALYDDYVAQIKALEVTDELKIARDELKREDEETGLPIPADDEAIARVYELRRRAIEAITAIDETFFDDLKTVAGTAGGPAVERLRRNRARQRYTGSASSDYIVGRDRSNEGSVDVGGLVWTEEISAAEVARIDAILARYEERTIDAFRARLEAQLDLQQLFDRWAAEVTRTGQTDVVALVALQKRYREDAAPLTQRVAETNRAVIDLNRATMDEIVAALAGGTGVHLREAYDRAAFPTIFDDPLCVNAQLTRVLALDDLTPEQHERIDELAADYRPEYDRLSRDMAALLDQVGAKTVVGFDTDDFKEWQQREQRMAKLRYDRSELNARAIGRLKTILAPDQINRIGGLPDIGD